MTRHALSPDETLGAARGEVEAALIAMMAQPQSALPFIVIRSTETESFVQFRGSKGENLIFDVPAWNHQEEFGQGAFVRYEEAATAALSTLGDLVTDARMDEGVLPGASTPMEIELSWEVSPDNLQ